MPLQDSSHGFTNRCEIDEAGSECKSRDTRPPEPPRGRAGPFRGNKECPMSDYAMSAQGTHRLLNTHKKSGKVLLIALAYPADVKSTSRIKGVSLLGVSLRTEMLICKLKSGSMLRPMP
jgi:hypothetical protein